LAATALALGTAGQLAAQQAHPVLPLAGVLGRPKHLPPAPANAPALPKVELDATGLGSPLVLDKGWRVGVTANERAASPDFDDSTWPIRTVGQSLDGLDDLDDPSGGKTVDQPQGSQPVAHGRPFVWFRMHVKLARNHGPLALLIELPVTPNSSMTIGATGPGVDVFANGKQIQPEGPHGDSPGRYQEISRIYDLGIPPGETDLVLVARTIYIPFGLSAYTSFFANGTLGLGHRADLDRALELWTVHSLFERLPRLVNAILFIVLSLFLLALYFTQKGHVEYLWLALHEFIQAPIGFIDLAGSFARLDQVWYAAIILQLVMISAYLYFEFLIAFLALKRRWYIVVLRYTAPVLAGVGPAMLLMGSHSLLAVVTMAAIFLSTLFWMIGWTLFTFLTLIRATLRRNFEAGLLLIPLMLTIVGLVEPMLTGGMSDFSGHPYRSPLTIQAGLIPIHFASIADFAGLLTIVLIIFVRFLRIQRDQEHANSELAAARSVQELMIPHEKLETPGYEVDSVYTPANEVGGDFFHVQPSGDGGMLVVIGDVAGKGLQAAMTVSMLMGALRGIPEKSPGRILESLNRVLSGGEGLTTCQAIWFGADGELVVANAGHLPPYLNSQEIVLPGGLPLGAIPDVSYDEVSLYLHPGDRLLMLSDGVVEARRPTGELFGFDRVHNLSNQTAFYIADAAKEFGQEDDITVLTVRRMAAAMAA
jgi:hypothetical protein